MPAKCCVPNCKGNYATGDKVSVFSFPNDEFLKEEWERRISRDIWKANKTTVVCEKHFHPSEIVRVDNFTTADGDILKLPRKNPRLKEDAVPSIFPNLPEYSSKRKSKGHPRKEIVTQIEVEYEMFVDQDIITSFEELKTNFKTKLKDQMAWWSCNESEQKLIFFKLLTVGIPKVEKSICINNIMKVEVFLHDEQVKNSELHWVLNSRNLLERWSQLDSLLTYISDCPNPQKTMVEILKDATSMLEEAATLCDNEEQESLLEFVAEQVRLSSYPYKTRRYNSDLMRFAYLLYEKSPSCYAMLRESNFMVLPHTSTLKMMSSEMESVPCDKKIE